MDEQTAATTTTNYHQLPPTAASTYRLVPSSQSFWSPEGTEAQGREQVIPRS